MANVYADLVERGIISLDDVNERMRPKVEEILKRRGYIKEE